MRVNVYAEEMTDRIEIISKEIDGHKFTGLRLYLYMPVTLPDGTQAKGPFIHRPGDDDSSAITIWGKRDLRLVLSKMLSSLDDHYATADASDIHTKIGNGHGGFEHPSNETACRLPSRGRRVDMNVEKVTCPKCVEVCLTMFGQP